jgi:hypothetical protein
MKVVQLGPVRDLRAQWEAVRDAIVQGRVSGFYLTVMDGNGKEAMYVGGNYKADPMAAAGAALKMSAVRMSLEDEPPQIEVVRARAERGNL